jgi:DNA-nicking Smr family endonuclease
MAKRDGSRRRGLSQEERVLWTTVTRSIAPMRSVALPVDTDVDEEKPEPPRPAKRAMPATPVKAEAPPPLAPLAPLGRRMRRSVARGKEAIDARFDLHGLTQAQAHAALLRFLRDASARDARLVLVITGKGAKNLGSRDGERGVLKRQVPQWLALPEFRSFVVGYEDASIRHGGEGALYVRLRRMRD